MYHYLWRYDVEAYKRKMPLFLSECSDEIRINACWFIGNNRDLLEQNAENLIEVHGTSSNENFKYCIRTVLLTLNNDKINERLAGIPGGLIDASDVVNNVLTAYRDKKAEVLFKNADRKAFVFTLDTYHSSISSLAPAEPESQMGSAGDAGYALRFLTGGQCLSVDRISEIKVNDEKIREIGRGKYYANINRSDTFYKGWDYKTKYFKKGYFKYEDLVFNIFFEIKRKPDADGNTNCGLNKVNALSAVVAMKDRKLFLSGVIAEW
jgi:hypothetical protein